MKILVDFIRAEQHWLPDTEEQQNYLVFGFGGLEHRIPCEEDDIVRAVREARGAAQTEPEKEPEPVPSPARFSRPSSTVEEMEFGGDVEPVVNPPVIFEKMAAPEIKDPTQNSEELRRALINQLMESRPRSKASLKAEKLARMRAVAATAPKTRVGIDEAGNPEGPGVQPAAPVQRKTSVIDAADDDPFAQG